MDRRLRNFQWENNINVISAQKLDTQVIQGLFVGFAHHQVSSFFNLDCFIIPNHKPLFLLCQSIFKMVWSMTSVTSGWSRSGLSFNQCYGIIATCNFRSLSLLIYEMTILKSITKGNFNPEQTKKYYKHKNNSNFATDYDS